MKNIFLKIKKKGINLKNISEKTFLLGLFLLGPMMVVGIFLILLSSVASIYLRKDKFLKDKSAIFLICISILMIISCIYQTLNFSNRDFLGWDSSLTWIGLLNWIPFFYLFWSAQSFLKTNSQRIRAAKMLVFGIIPIVITGIGQYFFNWQGPFTFLYGTIVWYLKPIPNHLGLSGLFSNQNYAGTWLSTIWPLIMGILLIDKKNIYKRSLMILIISIFTFTTILTTSRNAILGMLISIPIVLGIKSLIIFGIIFLLLFLFNASYLSIPSFFTEVFTGIIPEQLINKFNKIGLNNLLDYRRINLWNNTINLLIKRPIFGYGAAFFPIIYAIKFSDPVYTERHTHNIFFELASGYGLLVSILLFYFIISIFINSFKSIRNKLLDDKEKLFSKTWFASSIVIFISQMNDITYYDGRISVIFWLLIAGLNNIGFESYKKIDSYNSNSR